MKYALKCFLYLAFLLLTTQIGLTQSTRSTFGFSYKIKENDAEKYVEILEIINNAGAQKAGLRTGDLLEEIDAIQLEGLSNYKK